MSRYSTEKFRLRPSVSLTPLPQKGRYQFFLSDIRQSFNMDFADEVYTNILRSLDGRVPFEQLVQSQQLTEQQIRGLEKLLEILIERCVVEDANIILPRTADPFRRVKNFMASYVPYDQVEAVWAHMVTSHVAIVGVGGVGSWVVHMLAQFGIQHLTLLDDDIVKPHNMNRSLFQSDDVGMHKTQALERMLEAKKSDYYTITSVHEKLHSPQQLIQNLQQSLKQKTVIINCADFPSVAQTSAIINEAAFACDLPYIIAGGYNMHLSLVGPTVIPRQTPCFHCISHGMDQVGIDALAGAERIVKEHRNLGNIGPLAAISASFAANECLKLLVGAPYMRPTMLGKRGEFNFLTKKLILEEYKKWSECPYCGKREEVCRNS